MKKSLLSLLAWSMPFLLLAQTNASTQSTMTKEGPGITEEKGIHWTTDLTWVQVKQKAKVEKKYIFVDAYATWCGPCKLMDKNVYTSDTVGELLNENFVAIKVQMDKTVNDNEEVKKRYKEADSLKNQYQIVGYPTLLFLNPDGEIIDKQLGFKPLSEFITIIKSAILPGKTYDDPYVAYRLKLSNYKQGVKNYDQYPDMIRIANKLGDTSISRQLTKELTNYVASLPSNERYTKERIELWNNSIWGSNTKVFGYFYNDAKLVNKVMNNNNYAENFIDKTIQYEFVIPFLREQAKGSGVGMEGAYLAYNGTGPAPNANYSEADWGQLEKLLVSKFGKYYARRNVLKARVEWYTRHLNKYAVIEYSLKLFDNYPPDVNDRANFYYNINEPAWAAFLTSTDKKILKGYAKWMRNAVQHNPKDDAAIDTYANLLYKLGCKKKAIKWEEKAVKLVPKDKGHSAALEKMKKGEPTYIDQGALWPKTAQN